jgi:hypothetical protein
MPNEFPPGTVRQPGKKILSMEILLKDFYLFHALTHDMI